MTKPTQDKETLREAVRAAYEHGFNSVPAIAAILPDGTPAAHWAGLDAAIATMFERLRTPSEGMMEAGVDRVRHFDLEPHLAEAIWQAMLTAFQQENSDA